MRYPWRESAVNRLQERPKRSCGCQKTPRRSKPAGRAAEETRTDQRPAGRRIVMQGRKQHDDTINATNDTRRLLGSRTHNSAIFPVPYMPASLSYATLFVLILHFTLLSRYHTSMRADLMLSLPRLAFVHLSCDFPRVGPSRMRLMASARSGHGVVSS